MTAPKFYITTAIAYVNGPPHLGHAYEVISTDVIARFKRLDGHDVHFLTGTDEHGQKVEKNAVKAGKSPKEFADEIAALFQAMDRDFGISHDAFIRTTEPRHYKASQAIWRRLKANGDIYLGKYAGWYSVRDEAFYGADETETRADGKRHARTTGTEVEWVEEPSYFFRLSAYTQKLLDHYEAHPDFIQPAHRRNEIVAFVKQGLTDLSVSRTTFNWGVPVPDDPQHVMYVWLDALTNYITAVGYPDESGAEFRKWWPADVHIIGKDIVRFHTVYWPAFLMSAGVALPKRVFGHGFLTVGGEKMSKSLGNIITPDELRREFGVDQTRYVLMRDVPYGQDGAIGRDLIAQRINSDLANDFGNLAQRTLSQIARNCDAKVPAPGPLSADDQALLAAARDALAAIRAEMENFAIHRMLEAIWRVVGDANRYIDKQAPWALKKTDPARMATVLWTAAEAIRHLAIYAQPVVPGAAARLLDQLGVPPGARRFADLATPLAAGTPLPPPAPIFPRYQAADAAPKKPG